MGGYKRSILLLEQLILAASMHKLCMKVSIEKNGLDFDFAKRNSAQRMVDFLKNKVPMKKKSSKQLVSHNPRKNSYNFKFVYFLILPKISRYDLAILPKKLC